jgi:hypothetical protein
MSDGLAVLIMSCDAYDDTWRPFFHFFDKYWPDCPYTIYFASNYRYPDHPRIVPLLFNQESNWSEELLSILGKIPESHLMYIQDDYFLLKKVESVRVDSLWKEAMARDIAYLRLFPLAHELPFPGTREIGPLRSDSEYLTSLQTAIWKKDYLASLLVVGESPWAFEHESPVRARATKAVFASAISQNKSPSEDEYPFYYFCTAILKGKWMRDAWNLCRREGIILDRRRRKVQSWWDINKDKIVDRSPKPIRKYVSYVVRKAPW